MGGFYAAVVKSPLPRHLVVRVVVARRDGELLTPEDVARARAAYPQPKKRKTSKTMARTVTSGGSRSRSTKHPT